MSQHENIIGLDIGSSKIRVAVGQKVYSEDSKLPKLNIIGAVEVDSEGVNRGVITNIDGAVKSISKALDKAERVTGVPIEAAWVGVGGTQIHTQLSRGIVAVSKTDGEISEEDVHRAIEAARTVNTPPNYEILHVVPRSFAVDGQEGVKDPIGMKGMRLEVDTFIIEGMNSQVKNLTKAIYQTGLDIEDLVLNALACSEAVLTPKQKELGVAVVNIGSSTTSVSVYEQGDLLHVNILPIGSEHITSDVAIGLRTSIEVAEEIKVRFGQATTKDVEKKAEINLAEISPSEEGMVSKKYVYEIIEARVEEIFSKVDMELKTIDRSGVLPAGIVITGGGARLPKIVEVAKMTLRLPASLGYPTNVSSVIDTVDDLGMTGAIGLVIWGDQVSGNFKGGSKFKSINEVTSKMKKWLKSMVP